MQLLTVILKDATKVNSILRELAEEGVSGGTIIDGKGMGEAIADMTSLPMFNMLRGLFADEEETSCKIIMFVMKDEQIVEARKTIKRIVNLKEPNSGIMFEIPLTYVSGLSDND
ncbi:MAG: hypothetical protein J5824_10675 [Lachnospiraceae bacterium]|nr:hypothetical protein [Lachnospiraceae bacterium]